MNSLDLPVTSKTSIGQHNEFELIERWMAVLPQPPKDFLGVGDDCAAIELEALKKLGRKALFTTDSLVDGRHFQNDQANASDVGWKLIAVSLSDIAAMGGTPVAALLNFQLPSTLALEWMDRFVEGIRDACVRYNVAVIGGNCSSSNELSFTSTIIGMADRPLTRRGATSGDLLFVSGSIGNAAAGLRLQSSELKNHTGPEFESLKRAHSRPQPRIELGRRLAETRLATALIDISDGLLQDAGHIAEQSGVALVIDLRKLPLAASLGKIGLSPIEAAVGGEDYELLFSADPSASTKIDALKDSSLRITEIGYVEQGEPAVFVIDLEGRRLSLRDALESAGLKSAGFTHFARE